MNFGAKLESEFLKLIQAGFGRSMAARELGIGYNRFRRILNDNPAFAAEVECAESARAETCEYELLQMVTSQDNPSLRLRAAIALLNHHDRAAKLRQTSRKPARARGADDPSPDAS